MSASEMSEERQPSKLNVAGSSPVARFALAGEIRGRAWYVDPVVRWRLITKLRRAFVPKTKKP